MRKKSVNHVDVAHVLDGCHLCEHYIIMYAYASISIYYVSFINGTTHRTSAVCANGIFNEI